MRAAKMNIQFCILLLQATIVKYSAIVWPLPSYISSKTFAQQVGTNYFFFNGKTIHICTGGNTFFSIDLLSKFIKRGNKLNDRVSQ